MDKYYSDNSYYNDNYNNDSIINDDIDSRETMKIMLTFILFISFCNPCMHLIKSLFIKCKNNYKINKIPIIKIRSNDNLLLDECSICLERYNKNDKIICLDCNHMFHKNCLLLWLDKNNSCPQCRETII